MMERYKKTDAARAQLVGKVDSEKCMENAGSLANKIRQMLYRSMLNCQDSQARYMLTIDNFGQPSIITVPHDAIVGSIKDLHRMISDPGLTEASTDDLIRISHACLERMSNRLF